MSYPALLVEAAFTASATESGSSFLYFSDTVRGLFDTGTFAGEIWADITPYVRSLTVQRGSSRFDGPTIRYEAGRATVVLDNRDRRFDPTNVNGPYAVSGVSQVTPMRAVRIRATHEGIIYDVFRGFADEWAIEWPTKTVSRGDSVCTLRATDATKVLANYDGPAQVSQGGGEDSGARASRVLDNADWSAADRVIATGDTLLQATTLDSPAWDELQSAADAEGGEVYVDAAGRVTFRNRRAALTDLRSVTSQAVFGDGGDPELRYFDVTLNNDDTTLRNLVTVTRDGGVAQTVSDTDSIAQYLTRTWAASGMSMQSDADALNLAQSVLYQSKTPELRFDTLTVSPRRDEDVLFPEVLGRELGDRITVRRRPPYDRPADEGTYDSGTYDAGTYDSSSGVYVGYDDSGYGYDSIDVEYGGIGTALVARDVFIRGIQHEASPQHWVTVWALQSATLQSWLIFDDPVLGVFDSSAFAY